MTDERERRDATMRSAAEDKGVRLNAAVDMLNGRFGRGTLHPVAVGAKQHWATKRESVSPRYTTCLEEIPIVKA
jgi:DNA polymerase V